VTSVEKSSRLAEAIERRRSVLNVSPGPCDPGKYLLPKATSRRPGQLSPKGNCDQMSVTTEGSVQGWEKSFLSPRSRRSSISTWKRRSSQGGSRRSSVSSVGSDAVYISKRKVNGCTFITFTDTVYYNFQFQIVEVYTYFM